MMSLALPEITEIKEKRKTAKQNFPSFEEVLAFARAHNLSKRCAEHFYKHFKRQGWRLRNSKANSAFNWKMHFLKSCPPVVENKEPMEKLEPFDLAIAFLIFGEKWQKKAILKYLRPDMFFGEYKAIFETALELGKSGTEPRAVEIYEALSEKNVNKNKVLEKIGNAARAYRPLKDERFYKMLEYFTNKVEI